MLNEFILQETFVAKEPVAFGHLLYTPALENTVFSKHIFSTHAAIHDLNMFHQEKLLQVICSLSSQVPFYLLWKVIFKKSECQVNSSVEEEVF